MTDHTLGADEVLGLRLERQLIERRDGTTAADPAAVVRCLGAMQAQDYPGALWSAGLRCGDGCTASDVQSALAERRIVRTWPMRGTLHFVPPEDVRWMIRLLSPRVLARARGRHEQLGVTAEIVERACSIFSEALAGGQALTRAEMMALLESDGISTTGQAGYHILWTLAQHAVLCLGPPAGPQQTFVLLDEWVPPTEFHPRPAGAAALALLAARYFEAHGPATIADFAWWAGITKTEARSGIEGAGDRLRPLATADAEYWLPADVTAPGRGSPAPSRGPVHLLPGFDEYFLGYTDRTLQLGDHVTRYGATISANGMFSPTLVAAGRVAGTWKRTLRRDRVDIAVRAFRRLTRAEQRGLVEAAEQYGRFVGLSANLGMADD